MHLKCGVCLLFCCGTQGGGVTGFFHFLELATVGGRFSFSKWCLTCCQRGTYFDLPWGPAITPSKNCLFRTVFLQFHVFMLFKQCLSLCRGVSARFRFLELATVGGRFYFFKWCLTGCQRGTYFVLPWGPSINPSKNYLFRTVFFLQFQVFMLFNRCWVCAGVSRLGSDFLS
jgi:hypothetical protein